MTEFKLNKVAIIMRWTDNPFGLVSGRLLLIRTIGTLLELIALLTLHLICSKWSLTLIYILL